MAIKIKHAGFNLVSWDQ